MKKLLLCLTCAAGLFCFVLLQAYTTFGQETPTAGGGSVASDSNSTAAGSDSVASDSNSTAAGNNSAASDSDSVASDSNSTAVGSSSAAAQKGIITAIQNQADLESPAPVTVWKNDEEPLYERMVELRRVTAAVLLTDGTKKTMKLTVDWDISRLATDFDTPGSYTETAAILAPDGYVFGPGVLQTISIPVLVEEGTAEPDRITGFADISHSHAWAIPAGSDWDAFFSKTFSDSLWRYSWPCTLENGETAYVHVSWEDPEPDTGTAGLIAVHGIAVLPEELCLADGVTLPEVSVSVSVQAEGAPELNCWFLNYGAVNLPWVSGGCEDTARILVSGDGTEWMEDDDFFFCDNLAVRLSLAGLKAGSSYRVKAIWDNGETGVFSFVWDGDVTLAGYHKGDRDGGDAGNASEKEFSQPAPLLPEEEVQAEAESDNKSAENTDAQPAESENAGKEYEAAQAADAGSPTAENTEAADAETGSAETGDPEAGNPEGSVTRPNTEPVSEFFGETTERISGSRFLLMLETGEQSAVFSRQGVRIRIPATAPALVSVRPEDQLEIRIEREPDNAKDTFSFEVSVNDTPIFSLPGASVMLPLPQDTDGQARTLPCLVDEDGRRFPLREVDEAAQAAVFEIDHTGTYGLTYEDEADSTHSGQAEADPGERTDSSCSLPPVRTLFAYAVPALLLFSVLFLIYRIRRTHREP